MKKIIFITGGQRSGKSVKAEQLALSLSDTPTYLATAHIWDDDFRERVRIHQERRGPQWRNIEEELELSKHDVTGRVVLVDCCTLWAANYITKDLPPDCDTDSQPLFDPKAVFEEMKSEFDKFTAQDATFIFVSNEIGLGGVSPNALQRRFADLLGWLNQHIASKADEVILMVSGIELKIK